MRNKRGVFPVVLFSFLLSVYLTRAQPGQDAGIGKMTDIHGIVHEPSKSQKTVAVVFIYVDITCPIANFYQPLLRRLAKTYEPKGIRFYQIHPDPDGEPSALVTHAKEYEVVSPVILDSKQALAEKHTAKVTPEAHVYLPDGSRIYRGRIDNTYATYGKRRPEATSHELRDALQAAVAGRRPATAVTEAVGCQILIER